MNLLVNVPFSGRQHIIVSSYLHILFMVHSPSKCWAGNMFLSFLNSCNSRNLCMDIGARTLMKPNGKLFNVCCRCQILIWIPCLKRAQHILPVVRWTANISSVLNSNFESNLNAVESDKCGRCAHQVRPTKMQFANLHCFETGFHWLKFWISISS